MTALSASKEARVAILTALAYRLRQDSSQEAALASLRARDLLRPLSPGAVLQVALDVADIAIHIGNIPKRKVTDDYMAELVAPAADGPGEARQESQAGSRRLTVV